MRTIKLKPCTTGTNHAWSFVKNVSVGSMSYSARGAHGRFTLKGLYSCACGASKYGPNDPNQYGDLRNLVSSMDGQEGGAA